MADQELTQRVIKAIASTQKIEPEKITIDSTFEELGIDSLDAVNILFALESEFDINIPDNAAEGFRSVRQVVDGIEKLIAGKGETAPKAS